ncbi:flagellar transcriptional activator FlhC (plasmid) [Pararobbsia alpina]|uniref:FlhC family transcriptional regulator n=1 Tax=Pararobbsia alpina TaxID=621374 RepID=UPI0039A4A160
MLEDSAHPSDRLLLPRWIAERIRHFNYQVIDWIDLSLKSSQAPESVFKISTEDIEKIREPASDKAKLLATSFLMVEPTLSKVEDWEALIDARTTTQISSLTDACPSLGQVTRATFYYQNKAYISLLIEVLNMSFVAAPICGISLDVARFLLQVPQHRLESAIARSAFPLFRWRITVPLFWHDLSTGTLKGESLMHYLMRGSPVRIDDLPAAELIGDRGFTRLQAETYADFFLRLGARASTVSESFHMTATAARSAYKRIHDESSPVGKKPTSVAWYVESSRNRMHATVFTWLYRAALGAGANAPEAHIAAYALYRRQFGGDFVLALERACSLTRTMATDSTLAVVACRSCGTPYIIANNDTKVELPNRYHCPVCTNTLNHGRGRAKGKIDKTDPS